MVEFLLLFCKQSLGQDKIPQKQFLISHFAWSSQENRNLCDSCCSVHLFEIQLLLVINIRKCQKSKSRRKRLDGEWHRRTECFKKNGEIDSYEACQIALSPTLNKFDHIQAPFLYQDTTYILLPLWSQHFSVQSVFMYSKSRKVREGKQELSYRHMKLD